MVLIAQIALGRYYRRSGLYVNPPDHAIVLSVDEKSQIQALDRTQPGLPMKRGRLGTITHDYKRHGTTTLFAAIDVLQGKVIGQCMKRHRHQEFIRFLNVIDARVPAKLTIHVIVDNYAAHKHPKVLEWLAGHPTASGELPLDFMLREMRNEKNRLEFRAQMARAAAPYLHPQLSAVAYRQLDANGAPLMPTINVTIESPPTKALPSPAETPVSISDKRH